MYSVVWEPTKIGELKVAGIFSWLMLKYQGYVLKNWLYIRKHFVIK